jgi:AraC-like DNA-binding protein/DNA-binding LacI/PurR family transcriptional regulator
MTHEGNNLVLGFNFFPGNVFHSARIEGIRRFARLGGWDVEFFTPQDVPATAIRQLLARRRPIGCLVECSRPNDAPPYAMPTPGVFGNTPVVYVDPQTTQERRRIRHAAALLCDNAAIARMAFRELSADHPPAYAAVPYVRQCGWSVERVATFRALCVENGKRCLVFPYRIGEGLADRLKRLADWLAALPRNCAVFAINDRIAWEVLRAFRDAGRAVPRTATLVGVDGNDKWPDAMPSRISSVKLDFGNSGYLAASLLASRMTDRAARGMTIAAYAANDGARRAKDGIPSLPPKAVRHCAAGASSLPPQAASSLPKVAAAVPAVATFGPLCVLRRESTRGRGRRDPRILEAAEMIRREASEGLTVAALAKRFGCSRRLFEIRFREAMGHSALDEILHVRLSHAQALLAHGDMPVAAVADFCGFGSERQMRRVFLASTGMSPREWRKTNFM